MPPKPSRIPLGPLLVALAATATTIATLNPKAGGPGVTCDELYHVAAGKQLVASLTQQGPAFFTPAAIRRNFHWPLGGPPVQAPLGHWMLGAVHRLFDPAPEDPAVISIIAARFAPALAFGILVLLVGLWTTRLGRPLAGTVASVGVALVPRVFGHAHFAALDMLTTLFVVAALFAVAEATERGRWWQFALAGVVWGMAMLVRLHGLLLLPPVVVWLIWRSRRQALVGLTCWFSTGMATLLVGWPWLWLAPIGHLWRYVASGSGRTAVHVFYLGQIWADRDVPWHYPLVMFAVTLPLGLLLLGAIGVWARRRAWRAEPQLTLLTGSLIWLLAIFALPGVPVYDGVRLLLIAFPLWAVWVGIGASWIVEHPALPGLSRRVRVGLLILFLTLQATGILVYHPCQLSHYNLLVGGLPGAERLGFEVSYWGDAVTEPLLVEAAERAEDGRVLFGPGLAPFQAPALAISSPALVERRVDVVGWDPSRPKLAAGCRYAIVYHRRADLPAAAWMLREGQIVAEHRKQGVWLSRLVELPGEIRP